MPIQIAKQQTVDDINNKVGVPSGNDWADTLFGWFFAIAQALLNLLGSVSPYPRLRLNAVYSPKVVYPNAQYHGILLKYNDTYDIIVQVSAIVKVRRSDGARIAACSIGTFSSTGVVPIILNDYLFTYLGGVDTIIVVDLNAMTSKQVKIPNNSSGGIPNLGGGSNCFDVRHVSGNNYQCVCWVDATNDGILVFQFDVTAPTNTVGTQISWLASPVYWVCFGTSDDSQYYYTFTTGAETNSRAMGRCSITNPSSGQVTLMQSSRIAIPDTWYFRSLQNSAVFALMTYTADTFSYHSDIILVKKDGSGFSYAGLPAQQQIGYHNGNRTFSLCYTKRADAIALSDATKDIFILPTGEIQRIRKDPTTNTTEMAINNSLVSDGLFREGILDYDLVNNKVWHSSACWIADNALVTSLSTQQSFAIREYDII